MPWPGGTSGSAEVPNRPVSQGCWRAGAAVAGVMGGPCRIASLPWFNFELMKTLVRHSSLNNLLKWPPWTNLAG